jgi:Poxvirus A32 protein
MSEVKLKKINDVKVKPFDFSNQKRKIKGSALFSLWCPNIFLLAKKFSGKTTTLINILQKVSGDLTKFIFIVSTIDKDESYKELIESLGERAETFKSIIDEERTNIIKQFIESRINDNDDQDQDDNNPDDVKQIGAGTVLNNFRKYGQIGAGKIEITKEGIKPVSEEYNETGSETGSKAWKKPYPEYIIVMDDLGSEMRDRSVTQLLKTNRHYNTMVIMSSQSLTDLDKPARNQLDYMLIFPKIPEDKLKSIKEDLNLSISLDEFLGIYDIATKEKYNFLYIGRSQAEEEYRKNFNEKFIINND